MELVKKKETSAPVVDLPLISDDKQSDKAATEEENTRKLPDYHLDSFNKTDNKSKEREYLDSDMESDEGDYHGSDDIDIPFSTLADIVGEDLKVAEEMRNARLNSVVDNDSLDNSSTGNAEETELHILDNTIKTKNIPNESQNNTNLTQVYEERKLLLLNIFKINNHSYFKDKKFTSISQENSKIHNDYIERLPNGTRTLCEMSDSNIVDEELSKKTTDSFTDPLSESELLKDIEEITVNEDGEEISTVENESSGVEPNISTSVCSPVASGSSLPVPSKNDRLMDFIMKNTLPTYTADISGFPVPSLLSLQRCVGCNDSFAFQFSLITHLERKTCHITYSCNVCSSTMIFYNRCRLLTHVRNHSDQGKEPILDSSAISFSILKPEDLSTLAKNGSPLTAPNVDNSSSVPTPPEEEQTNPHTTNSKESSSSQVPSSDLQAQAPGQDVEELPHNSLSENLGMQIQNTLEKPPCDKHDNPSRISVKVLNPSDTVEYVQTVESSEGEPSKNTELKICSECKSEVADLRLHFLATNKPLNSTIRCKHCDLVLTTKCSLSAHERTHTQSKPFICPECGRNYTFFSQLSVHLHYNCFHKAKCVRSMCVCNMLFILPSSFEEHITRHHVKTVYKCEKCQVACLSINELRVHMANAHKGLFEKQTYKLCTLCPDKLISVPNIATHIKRHAFGRQCLIYVYQCSTCKRVFHSKTVLSTHIDVCKRQMAQLKQNKLKMTQQYVAIKIPCK